MLTVLQGDALTMLRTLPSESVQCCVTSPPYWGLRDYSTQGQLGLEPTPEAYVTALVGVMAEVKRVLRPDGTLWLNLGDSYYNYRPGGTAQTKQTLAMHNGAIVETSAKRGDKIEGLKEKDLCGIPWRTAFALQSHGWYLRADIIWAKPNPMPESVTDRPTKAHEYVFLLTKSQQYFYDAEAIKEKQSGEPHAPGNMTDNSRLTSSMGHFEEPNRVWASNGSRNKRSVWTIPTSPYPDAHFATYPPDLITPMILAGSKVGDVILDPFAGSGTTGQVALELGRKATLIELNPHYVKLINQRCSTTLGLPLA